MSAISRREFLESAATYAAAAGFLSSSPWELRANPLGMPLGCQTWPVREMIAKDFPGTIKQLATAGFQTIELCSPVGYADNGFAGLAKYSGTELRKILSDAGVSCVSSHFGIDELRKDQAGRITWAKDVGLTQMIVPSLDGPKNLEGKRTYDVLFELLDPKLVKFQFQVSTISRGYDAAEYFTKYPGRFISMHVQGWSAEAKKIMPVGQDTLDWKKIFAAAKTGGIKNYFVEMNLEMMKASVPYLHNLQVG